MYNMIRSRWTSREIFIVIGKDACFELLSVGGFVMPVKRGR